MSLLSQFHTILLPLRIVQNLPMAAFTEIPFKCWNRYVEGIRRSTASGQFWDSHDIAEFGLVGCVSMYIYVLCRMDNIS